jgi:eukaryotic-like serine/threonine-protein kinase
MVAASSDPPRIARRYQRLGIVGRGATGAVYRARDHLHRRIVALKTISPLGPPDTGVFDSQLTTSRPVPIADLLAREFLLLARLRHPNVVASLDYGHDDTGRPFFTMDLQENACTLREATRDRSMATKVDLLVQLLHALAYLHRRGLVHRDVKPDNALCTGGVVKLVDFGLAVATGHVDEWPCGTLAYCAPEVLRGAPVSARTDLYSVGVIAHEILTGRHPFDTSSPAKLLQSVFQSSPDFTTAAIAPGLGPVLQRLLARNPADRFESALEVVGALTAGLGRPLPLETVSTRESFLQSAAFIGRDRELQRLRLALPIVAGRGGAWVVCGESGVGKSRLLEELAVEAMVLDVRVLRGQSLRAGSRPYEPWTSVLRLLLLLAEPTTFEASVVARVVPDAAAVLEREVPEAPELDPEATHVRLVRVLEALLRRCRQPLLLMLEDMQWAGAESLKLFARVQVLASELPVLLVATFRTEDLPALPEELSLAEAIWLTRLSTSAVARLCAAMIGDRGEDDDGRRELVELVVRKSDGNVFAVLEVVRTLADEAGGLERVAGLREPERLLAGRVERLLDRRVERLSEQERAFLRTAAIAGRELDLEVLSKVHPTLDVRACAGRAAEAAVLSSVEGRWWFSHDRLRDALIEALPEAERRRVHREVAKAVLAVAPGDASTLAHHFRAAGDVTHEKEFAALAGGQFLRSGAYHEAIPYFRRAIQLAAPQADALIAHARLQRQLGEALFRCGKLVEARESLAAALATLGRPIPGTPALLGWRILGEACSQIALRARKALGGDEPPLTVATIQRFEEAILAYTQLSRLAHHLNDEALVLYVTLSALNLSERGRLLAHHARLAAVTGAVMGIVPVHPWARFYFDTARRLGERSNETGIRAFVLAHQGYYEAGIGQWRDCREHLERSIALYDEIGDVRLGEESISILAYALFYKGETRRSLELFRRLERSGEERGDGQIVSWGVTNRIKLLVRSGRYDEVGGLLERVDGLLIDGITKAVRDGVRVDLELARGDLASAREAAAAAASRLEDSAPRSFMACSTYASIAETFVACWADSQGEDRRLRAAAARANRALTKVARVFPIAEPARLLHAGSFEAVRGRPARARALWERAARLAARGELPREEALARAALAANDAGVPDRAPLNLGCAATLDLEP